MKLIKIKDGLLEAENFFLASSFSDFAGASNVTRDINTEKIRLISNNKIERNFNYDEFVIELSKENFNTLNEFDYSMIYLGNNNSTFGIKDVKSNTQNNFWKILKRNNYIQAYVSLDGVNYKNIGGMEFEESVTKQGFAKHSNEDFILNNYRIYGGPYITIKNFPEGTICELYDINNNLLKTRTFDKALECKVFIDIIIEGYFTFKDLKGNVIYSTDSMKLSYGDIWAVSPYNFEIIYKGNVITNVNPALLQDLEELITIKNIGDKPYNNIKIGIKTSSDDLIQMSFDGENYRKFLVIDNIKGNEGKDIFIKIIKSTKNHNFATRDFQLVINE
ncbi:hypothetical protein G8V03_12195 [Clostridium botulinum D/C]|uniref:hypothetical protein n=1 Tax=Clostridium botulinum TaxID=1491 RepID=UPI001E37CD33|nr:hypothetical protein [Clostridium botulinum]MCD3351766.1 hypothetical protein [Clostridium botulinum D/C]MCD3360692.1 hypothetical protein [Clostridium botulinum D/C]MCD3362118.1 hypothetical protein [Clostridium botulinum D/C]MCD3366470.1 hypothetical protein [Clostridium botulinum D/C]